MNDKERKRMIDQRNRDEYVRIMREKARRKQAAKASGGCLLYILLALIIVTAFVVCGCYPDEGPYKPPEHDPWKWGMLIIVVMAAIAGGWWYARINMKRG